MIKKIISFCILMILVLLTSCKTYLIPIESFREQFATIDSNRLRNVTVQGPGLFSTYNYLATPIRLIKCVDKKGMPVELKNSPSIEIRFTHGRKHKRTVFYFDRTILHGKIVIGAQSRFMASLRKSIPLDSITKIEVQDGKKKFSYIYN